MTIPQQLSTFLCSWSCKQKHHVLYCVDKEYGIVYIAILYNYTLLIGFTLQHWKIKIWKYKISMLPVTEQTILVSVALETNF